MRRALIQIHLWLGLTIGLLWALQGLTGAVLVFHRELQRWMGPEAVAGEMASVDELIANATKAAGGEAIVRLTLPDNSRKLVHAQYLVQGSVDRKIVVLDAATAEVVGEGETDPATPFSGSALMWIYRLHMELLSGHTGETFIGISGMVLLGGAITGLWVGWPPKRGWKSVIAVKRWSTVDHHLYGWHRAGGLAVGFFLILIALSGAYMVFSEEVRAAVGRIVAYQQPFKPEPVEVLPAQGIPVQQAVDTALGRFQGSKWVRVFLPTAAAPVITVRLHQPGESRAWIGATTVSLDPASGRVVHVYDALKAPLSNRIMDAAFPVHNGEIAGLPGRVLVMLVGLALPALYVTGVMRWLRRRQRKRQQMAKQQPQSAGATAAG
jgi:uncharacterized iron-regulated membrane protein